MSQMRRWCLFLATLSLLVATRGDDSQDLSYSDYDYYYDDVKEAPDEESSDLGDGWDDVEDQSQVDTEIDPADSWEVRKTTFCPWPPCFNEGESKSFEEILDITIKTTVGPITVPQEPLVTEPSPTSPEKQPKASDEAAKDVDYDYEAGEEVLQAEGSPSDDCEGQETVIVYRSEPNGVIIASIVFFVILVAIIFYLPRFYKRRFAQGYDSSNLIPVPQEDLEKGLDQEDFHSYIPSQYHQNLQHARLHPMKEESDGSSY